MAGVRIKVGASADASIETTFQKPDLASKRMAANVAKNAHNAGKALALGISMGVRGAEKELNKLHGEANRLNKLFNDLGRSRGGSGIGGVGWVQNFAKDHKKAFDSVAKDFDRAAKEARKFGEEARYSELKALQLAKAGSARGTRRYQEALGASMAGDIEGAARWKSKYFTGVSPGRIGRLGITGAARSVFGVIGRGIGRAERMAVDVAHGAGIETDEGAFVKSFVERQAKASDIVHSGYIPGAAGPNGQRQNAGDIQREALSVATATAQDPAKVLEGLQKFVAITGDLATGRAIMGDMAKLTLATGSDMQNVVEAAGEISAKLGDIPDKANVVHAVMRQIAGAGKMGAVEMRDFAAQLGKIAGYASRVEGGVDKNIGEMGLLMQVARQKGGAGSAAQAATSVGAFMETLATPAKLKKFEAITGRNPYTDASRTHLMNPEAILREALHGTGGDVVKLHEIFGKRAANISMGAANVYNEAGGGQAGDTALTQYFDQLRGSVLSLDDENKAAAEQMTTAQARTQRFNNMLQQVADEALPKLMDAFSEMGPGLIDAAKGMADAFISLTPAITGLGEFLGFYFGKKPNVDVTPGISHTNTVAALGYNEKTFDKDFESAKKDAATASQNELNSNERLTKAKDDGGWLGRNVFSVEYDKNVSKAQSEYDTAGKTKEEAFDALARLTAQQNGYLAIIAANTTRGSAPLQAPQDVRHPADNDSHFPTHRGN